MTRIEWFAKEDRTYESGLDRGVIYPYNGWGVSWNALVNVDNKQAQNASTTIYYEGVPFDIEDDNAERTSTVTAFTYPDVLDELCGMPADENGFGYLFGDQKREFFSMSYRTMIDQGPDYKIHVLINQKARMTGQPRGTHTETFGATNFTWELTGVPALIMNRNTTYVVLDSRNILKSRMTLIEDLLYGTPTRDPDFKDFLAYLNGGK